MKELSIEERAQRYDEAIERVVNIRTGKCETTFIFTEGLFNYLFPELEECNEEEVREAMIDFFKHEREEGVVVSHYGVNIERMIAWLEKQNSNVDNANKEYWRGYREGKQEILDKYAELERQGQTFTKKELKKIPQRMISAEAKEAMYGKPTAWSEEDEIGLGDAMWAIEQAKTIAKNENDMGNLWYAETWLKSLKERIGG